MIKRNCEVCKTEYVFKNKSSKFCSSSCRSKKWRKNSPEASNISNERWKKDNRDKVNKTRKKMYHRNAGAREKIIIRKITRYRLGKPERCGHCKDRENLNWHHRNKYSVTDVEPLCRPCHLKLHKHNVVVREE